MKISTPGLVIGIVLIIAALVGASFGFYQMGRSQGMEIGEKTGMARGLIAGEKAGYQKGYDAGKAEGEKSGYDKGYQGLQALITLLSQQVGDGSGLYEGEQVGYNDGYNNAYYVAYPAGWQTGWLAGYEYLYVNANLNANANVDVNVNQDPGLPGKPNLPVPGQIQIPKPPTAPSFSIPDHTSRFTHGPAGPGKTGLPGLRR